MEDKKRILVVGDIMVDRYTYVFSERVAPEAPIPVWDKVEHENRLGGAANVAHNLVALGGDEVEVYLAGIADAPAKRMFSRLGIDTVLCSGAETMYKDRFVDKQTMSYLFRCDNMRKFSAEGKSSFRKCMDILSRGLLFDAVIFSDYDKGTIDNEIVQLAAQQSMLTNQALVVVDSKRIDLSIFKGSHVLKVNESEYSTQVSHGPYRCVEELFRAVVVTKGSKGAELRQAVKSVVDNRTNVPVVIDSNENTYIVNSEEFPTIAVNARDVTGCGDTHTAALTFSLLKNDDIRLAVKFANECARNVVQKFGTSVVSR